MRKDISDLWVDKYSPTDLNKMILNENYRNKFQSYINDRMIPHLLFCGPPGGGKTTLAKILTNSIIQNKSDNLLIINGSMKGMRGIDFVNDTLEPFLSLPPIGDDKIKIVFVDEADKMTSDSFDSQRNLIEEYQRFNRFIFTANYLLKFPEAILSRFQEFHFNSMTRDGVFVHCVQILKNESIEYDDEDVHRVINMVYPDIRRMINILSKNNSNGKLLLNSEDQFTSENEIVKCFEEFIDCRWNGNTKININNVLSKMVDLTNNPDLNFEFIYNKIFYNKNIQTPTPIRIIVNDYAMKHKDCLIPLRSMNFMSMIFKSADMIKKYKNIGG